MSTVSTRFPYKERRVGKITKIALTRLTSTPLNPYGSRAEACQPQPVFSAACQDMAMTPLREAPASKTGAGRESASRIFRNVSIREEEEFFILFFL